MRRNTSQSMFILDALRRGEAITPFDAVERWSCWRLGARVYDLRRAGIPIIDLNKRTKTRFARYFLKPEFRTLTPDFTRISLKSKSKGIIPGRDVKGKFSGEKTVKKDTLERAILLYKAGKTYPEIGEILGFPWQTIYKRLKPLREAGILKSRPPGQPRQLAFSELGEG